MTETDPKQTERYALPLSLSLCSLYFNLFLSQSPPLPLSVSVSPRYFSLPVSFIPPLPFSPNVPTEADLMDDPLL